MQPWMVLLLNDGERFVGELRDVGCGAGNGLMPRFSESAVNDRPASRDARKVSRRCRYAVRSISADSPSTSAPIPAEVFIPPGWSLRFARDLPGRFMRSGYSEGPNGAISRPIAVKKGPHIAALMAQCEHLASGRGYDDNRTGLRPASFSSAKGTR